MDFDANGDPALLLSRLEELRLENDALKAAQNQHVHHHYAPDPEPTVSLPPKFDGNNIIVVILLIKLNLFFKCTPKNSPMMMFASVLLEHS